MTKLNTFLYVSAMIGVAFLVIGVIAVLSGGGTAEHVMALGHTLVIAGAVLIAGVVIGVAIISNRHQR